MPNWGKDFTEGLKAGRAVRKSWDEGRKEDEERAWRIKEGDVQAQAQWRAENNLRKGEGLEPLPRPEPYQEPQGWDIISDDGSHVPFHQESVFGFLTISVVSSACGIYF